jgi:hypothetical protein
VSRSSRADGVEAALRRADATLEAWFRRSRVTTRQASVVFARFLRRAKKRGAGVLRQRVEGLQGGLEQLSTGLEQMEKEHKPATTRRRPRLAVTRRPAARTRKPKKAA